MAQRSYASIPLSLSLIHLNVAFCQFYLLFVFISKRSSCQYAIRMHVWCTLSALLFQISFVYIIIFLFHFNNKQQQRIIIINEQNINNKAEQKETKTSSMLIAMVLTLHSARSRARPDVRLLPLLLLLVLLMVIIHIKWLFHAWSLVLLLLLYVQCAECMSLAHVPVCVSVWSIKWEI